MTQDTFKGIALERFDSLVHDFSGFRVLGTGLEGSEGGLESLVSSKDDISLFTFNRGSLVSSGNDGVSS